MPTSAIVIFDEIEQGKPIRENAGEAYLPAHLIESHEHVFRYRGSIPLLDIECGDLLIVEPRRKAATGELVLARLGEDFFVGRWWQKHGLRELRDPETKGDLRIKGVVNLIVRQA